MIRQAFAALVSAFHYLFVGLVYAVLLSLLAVGLGSVVGWFKVGYCLVAGCLS